MEERNENMIELISSAATEILPEKKRTKNSEIWKNDDDLKRLITTLRKGLSHLEFLQNK